MKRQWWLRFVLSAYWEGRRCLAELGGCADWLGPSKLVVLLVDVFCAARGSDLRSCGATLAISIRLVLQMLSESSDLSLEDPFFFQTRVNLFLHSFSLLMRKLQLRSNCA